MSKRAGVYKSEKRKRELSRLKRQEDKRQKRFNKGVSQQDREGMGAGGKKDVRETP